MAVDQKYDISLGSFMTLSPLPIGSVVPLTEPRLIGSRNVTYLAFLTNIFRHKIVPVEDTRSIRVKLSDMIRLRRHYKIAQRVVESVVVYMMNLFVFRQLSPESQLNYVTMFKYSLAVNSYLFIPVNHTSGSVSPLHPWVWFELSPILKIVEMLSTQIAGHYLVILAITKNTDHRRTLPCR